MPITSSSISSSDRPTAGEGARWRGFAATFALAAGLALAGLVAGAYAIDPYDTGRSRLFAKPGVRPQGPRTAAASRGRDPRFDAAIFGNSRIQLLSPERLDEATGLAFVQLSIPGSGPKEQFVLIDWFLRHRGAGRPARALVIGADEFWCMGDPAMPSPNPFPFWLFSASPLEYLRGLVRFDILEKLPTRLSYVFGTRPERARPDGYWDYEADYRRLGYADDPRLREWREQRPDDARPVNPTGHYPVAERFASLMAGLPREVAVVLVFPPIYAAGLPRPGTPREQGEAACKAAFRRAAAANPQATVIDWRVDRAETRDSGFFFDQTHYNQILAQKVEAGIAAALAGLARRPR